MGQKQRWGLLLLSKGATPLLQNHSRMVRFLTRLCTLSQGRSLSVVESNNVNRSIHTPYFVPFFQQVLQMAVEMWFFFVVVCFIDSASKEKYSSPAVPAACPVACSGSPHCTRLMWLAALHLVWDSKSLAHSHFGGRNTKVGLCAQFGCTRGHIGVSLKAPKAPNCGCMPSLHYKRRSGAAICNKCVM